MTAPDDDVVLGPIRRAILDLRRLMPSVRSATVTSVDPVRIQFDGEAAPVSPSPTTLVPVGPGDRVRVLHYGNTHLILGRVNTAGIPYREAAGEVTYNTGGAFQSFPLPAGRFTVAPNMQATVRSNAGAHSGATIRMYALSPTEARFHVRMADGSAGDGVIVAWTAKQMTPTSAEG